MWSRRRLLWFGDGGDGTRGGPVAARSIAAPARRGSCDAAPCLIHIKATRRSIRHPIDN